MSPLSCRLRAYGLAALGLLSGALTPSAFAGEGEVEKVEVVVKAKDLATVRNVALVSVYGDYKVAGRKILDTPGQYSPLESLAELRTTEFKQGLVQSQLLPFELVDEGTVTQAAAYATLIRQRLQETTEPDAADVVYGVAQLFGSKAKSENQKLEEAGMTTVEHSRNGYFVPGSLGVYALPSLNVRTRNWGALSTERESMFRSMGADAILIAAVDFAAVGNGGNVFGKESGRVIVTLQAALLLPDGRMPYTFYAQGVSSKQTLFRSANFGMLDQNKEFVQDAAVQMSGEAWDAAWSALQTRMSATSQKLQAQR